MGQRPGRVALRRPRDPQVVVGSGGSRIDPDLFTKVYNGLMWVPLFHQGNAEVTVCFGVPWIEP